MAFPDINARRTARQELWKRLVESGTVDLSVVPDFLKDHMGNVGGGVLEGGFDGGRMEGGDDGVMVEARTIKRVKKGEDEHFYTFVNFIIEQYVNVNIVK